MLTIVTSSFSLISHTGWSAVLWVNAGLLHKEKGFRYNFLLYCICIFNLISISTPISLLHSLLYACRFVAGEAVNQRRVNGFHFAGVGGRRSRPEFLHSYCNMPVWLLVCLLGVMMDCWSPIPTKTWWAREKEHHAGSTGRRMWHENVLRPSEDIPLCIWACCFISTCNKNPYFLLVTFLKSTMPLRRKPSADRFTFSDVLTRSSVLALWQGYFQTAAHFRRSLGWFLGSTMLHLLSGCFPTSWKVITKCGKYELIENKKLLKCTVCRNSTLKLSENNPVHVPYVVDLSCIPTCLYTVQYILCL